jgi:hypothetical protein
MAGPVTNPTASLYDQVQLTGAHTRGATPQAQDDSAIGWFLPGSDSNLQSIDANTDLDLQGVTPESYANRVLSHVGT